LKQIFREAVFDSFPLAVIINPDEVCNGTGLAQVFEKRS
jgi:hypothetical protein